MIYKLLSKPLFLIPVTLVLASLICYVTGLSNIRWDVTNGRKHSLTQNSKTLLQSLSRPVAIRFYLSRTDNSLPVKLRTYAERIDSLLNSVASASKGKITIERLDPKLDPDAAESAHLDGITPQTLSTETLIYMGLAFSSADQRNQISYLDPTQDSALEYEILSKIKEVSSSQRRQLGLISSLPISQPGKEWQIIRDLRDQYDIIPISAGKPIPDEMTTLLIVHPRGITKKFNQKIDAFTERGGSMIVIMDSASLAFSFTPLAKSLKDLTSSWPGLTEATGLRFTGDKPVADMLFCSKLDRGEGFEEINTILTINEQGIKTGHPITEGLTSLNFPASGAFTGQAHPELTLTPILQSTEQSALSETEFVMTASKAEVASRHSSFQADENIYDFSVLIEGNLRSLNTGKPRPNTNPSKLLLVGDSDFIADPYAGYSEQVQGNSVFVPTNNNLGFLYNAIDYLEDDTLLNDARAKTKQKRPLLKLREYEREIRSQYESPLAELEKELQTIKETGNHQNYTLTESARGKTIDIKSQNQELERESKIRSIRAKIAILKREMREKIQSMKSRIQWLNVLIVPSLIGFTGMIFLWFRKLQTRAREVSVSE